MEWIIKHAGVDMLNTRVVFQLEYINSSSSKMILELLYLIRQIFEGEKENLLYIEWLYLKDDEDLHQSGKDFEERIGINFKYMSPLRKVFCPQITQIYTDLIT